MSEAEATLYHLLTWLSPSYPVGAFAHSSGLEWAVEAGWVRDRSTLEEWLQDVLQHGAAWNDAVLLAATHRAAAAGDKVALARCAQLAAALHPSEERRIESLAQGSAFRRIAAATARQEAIEPFDIVPETETAYPVAVGILTAGYSVELTAALTAYLHAYLGNLVSAAQRLIPLGQTDGQTAIMTLKPAVLETVRRAAAIPPGDPFHFLGSATFAADLASMWHETQYTRLFRT
ncbi:MAG TPA: urease accessory protein UreF [Stellaceae bacterium]|jgi:urease accessory protein|nr:urease accessory protein UreF [Stellaceae bacterium]